MQKTLSSEHNDDKAEHVGQDINFRWRDVNQGLVHPDRKSKRDKKKRLHPSPVWCIHEFNCCYLQEHGPGITKEHRQLTSSYTTKEEASFFSTLTVTVLRRGCLTCPSPREPLCVPSYEKPIQLFPKSLSLHRRMSECPVMG